jgi:hypothetical protein
LYPFPPHSIMSEREIRIQQLFSTMQSAQRNKDIDPIAYRRARIAYHRESEGEAWIASEQESLREEAKEMTAIWKNQYTALQGLRDTHRTNLDIVRGAEAKQITTGSDFKYAVGELKRLVEKDKDATILTEREAYLRTIQYGPPSWAVYVLDGIIVLLLVLMIYMVYIRFGARWTATSALINYQKLFTTQKTLAASLREQLS